MGQTGESQSRRFDQGPHRRLYGGTGSGARRVAARRHAGGTHQRQHGYRPGHGGRGQGSEMRADHAGKHESGAPQAAGRPGSGTRADARRRRHGRSCPGSRAADGGHARRGPAGAVHQSRRGGGPLCLHGTGNLPGNTGTGGGSGGRGRHRRHDYGRRALSERAHPRTVRLRRGTRRVARAFRRQARSAPHPGHRRGFCARGAGSRPAGRNHHSGRRRRPGNGPATALSGRHQRRHFLRGQRLGGSPARPAAGNGREAYCHLDLRHGRALSFHRAV